MLFLADIFDLPDMPEIRGRHFSFRLGQLGALACLTLVGCFQNNRGTTSSTTTGTVTSSAPTVPYGPRAAKIIFKTIANCGSFANNPSSSGTTAAFGSGHSATTVFNPDNTSLSTSPTLSSWPQWISSIELGISGSSNSNATNSNCARFSNANEDTTSKCAFKYPSDSTLFNCGAPAGYYRVSDFDCYNVTNTTGNASDGRGVGSGMDTDGVYIRVNFNRSTTALGANENILAVLDYSASSLTSAPTNPSTCISGGSAAFDQCADFTWNIFAKHSASEALQPFLLLAPPALASVNATLGTGGTGISTTRQFVIPLAGDANLSLLQISRTGFSTKLGPTGATTPTPDTTFQNVCAPNGAGSAANSAFCVGTVFYSLTLYRI